MEKNDKQSSTINDYFSHRRNLVTIENILTFLNLEEVLRTSGTCSLLFNYIKAEKKTEQLRRIKLEYLNNPILNLNSIELLINHIKKEKKIEGEGVFEFLAFYIFKNIFCRLIHFNQHKSDTILNLMQFLKTSGYKYDSGVIQFTDNQFSEKPLLLTLQALLQGKRVCNLMKITIINSRLTDSCLDPIIDYLQSNSSLKILVLNGNEIGLTEKSEEFLHCIKYNANIEFVNLDLCYFTSRCIPILREIYLSSINKIKSLTMYFNMLSIQDVYNLFNVDSYDCEKKIGISFKYSPEYNLKNNNKEIVFGRNFILNKYDDNDFYDIYIDNVPFNSLTLVKLDLRIEHAIIRTLSTNTNIDSLVVDLNELSDKMSNYILDFIKNTTHIRSVSLSEMKEKFNPQTGSTYYKIFNFLSVLKDCEMITNLKFWNVFAKGWTKELLEIPKNRKIEELSISNCKCIESEEYEQISEFIKSKRIRNANIYHKMSSMDNLPEIY